MATHLKTYPAPWEGRVLLACKKCQKKLKGNKHLARLGKLGKTAKRMNNEHPGSPVHVVNVGCMDLCPKHGVTVCDTAANPEALMIVRSEEDLRAIALGEPGGGTVDSLRE